MARAKSATIDLKVRMKEPLRARLEKSARGDGVSLNAQAVKCIERSLDENDSRTHDFGDATTLKLMRSLALAKSMAELTTGDDAFTDAETAKIAYGAMKGILDSIFIVRPGGPLDKTDPTEGQELIITDPEARDTKQNIRDAILEGLEPEIPALKASITKIRRS